MAKFHLTNKWLIGALGVTLVAKVASSLLLPPAANESPMPMTAAAIAAESEPPEETKAIPPLVEGLGSTDNTCEAPEAVMQALMKERELLAEQKQKFEARKSEIALARETLNIERQAILELRDSLKGLLAKVEAAQTDDLKRLIELYQNMKPADAARIMDDMDIETTIMILGTMKPRIAAPILAKMTPVRTRAVSKIILERSQLPGDQDLHGIRLN